MNNILLLHPCVEIEEGPKAYLIRLAEANLVKTTDLQRLGISFCVDSLRVLNEGLFESADGPRAYVEHIDEIREQWPTIWNRGPCRYCPICIAKGRPWNVGWELLFFDACPIHKCWLVDQCDACGKTLTWNRDRLNQCHCGHHLAKCTARAAPDAVVLLSCEMHRRVVANTVDGELAPLTGLNLDQVTRLVRFLGAYGQSDAERLPQKIRNVGSMDVSWQITSVAAEILCDWPLNFHRMLHAMLDRSAHHIGQRFPSRFGFFYSSLFRQLADNNLPFLRVAFESFVAEHWHASIAKRNTRLSQALFERVQWVTANRAMAKLRVSASRLSELVRSGALTGEERLSERGRRFLVIQKDSLEAMTAALADQVDLVTACSMLGLTKSRLLSSLSRVFPDARKVEGKTNHWAISRSSIIAFLEKCVAPQLASLECNQVTLDHVLRYWACSDSEVTEILVALRDGVIQPIGHLAIGVGLGHLVLNENAVRHTIQSMRGSSRARWTIPQAAEMLGIKQEVAYFLVRNGMLACVSEIVGRRDTAMVNREALDAFRTRYVFARDLAKFLKTSSRRLQLRLAEMNIYPVVSPTSGACRQVIYEQTQALLELFPTLAHRVTAMH